MGYVITSRLDNDFYNWTMGYVIWKWYRDFQVRYAFKNRSLQIPLLEYVSVPELQEAFDEIRKLRYTKEELQFLRDQKLFSEGYLEFLEDSDLPEVEVEDRGGWLNIEWEDQWAKSIFWESPVLAVVNELYFKRYMEAHDANAVSAHREGDRRLGAKIKILKEHPNIKFLEFGTRRRFSQDWQDAVIRRFLAEIPDQMLGTSNVDQAFKYGIKPSGTMAHQLFMVLAAKYVDSGSHLDPLAQAQVSVLESWDVTYGEVDNGRMLVALPDTFGTPYFLSRLTTEQGKRWNLRQDSGDPITVGDNIVHWYQGHNIDPKNHTLFFSDGLDVNRMISIGYHFEGRIPYRYGWGTDATNDLGFTALSTVAKPMSVDGCGCVKLSDDLAKATGSRDDINRYKELASYGYLY